MENVQLFHGDCLEVMNKLIDEGIKVDCIITDPPFGTTGYKWDSVIPFEEMWKRLNKIVKKRGAIVLFGVEPFSSALRMSNVKNFKYDWIWEKPQGTNFMQVKHQPYKVHEIISVFNIHNYYPQMTKGEPYISGKGKTGEMKSGVVEKKTNS